MFSQAKTLEREPSQSLRATVGRKIEKSKLSLNYSKKDMTPERVLAGFCFYTNLNLFISPMLNLASIYISTSSVNVKMGEQI
jgi:hypothetical protein